MRKCICGVELPTLAGSGRPRSHCSSACRQRAYRSRQVPAEMRGRRWVRADGKRPIRCDGRWASSTKSWTWSTLEQVRSSSAGDGFGIMLGRGLGCYDIDHATDAEIRRFVAAVAEPVVMVERSSSGHGAHVFVVADEALGWKRTLDGLSVERYTRERFIRTTLDRMPI